MELSRRASMTGLLAVITAPTLAPNFARAQSAGRWGPLEATANKMVADQLVPGLQICVRKDGSGAFSRGFGMADIETATPMTPSSVCRIGSVSKQFTAAGILLLAEDGKLSVDDPLARFIPDFPNAEKLTIRRLLSHTSGLGNYTQTTPPELVWQVSRTDRDTAQMLEVMRAASAKLLFEPGTNYRYSNTGFVLLGAIIEKASGQSYRDFLHARLFTPLGLAHTAVDDAAEIVPNRAAGYTDDPKAASGYDNASFTSMTYPGGAGAIRSTCEDLCVWHQALLGGKVLQPAMLKAMLTPITLNDGSLPPQVDSKGEHSFVHYGFGIGVEPVDGHPSVSHGGSIQGFGSFLETLPADQVTMAVIMNTDGGAGAPAVFGPAWAELQKTLRATALAA